MQKHNPETPCPCIFSPGLQSDVLGKEPGSCAWGLPVSIPSPLPSPWCPQTYTVLSLGALLRYLTFMKGDIAVSLETAGKLRTSFAYHPQEFRLTGIMSGMQWQRTTTRTA